MNILISKTVFAAFVGVVVGIVGHSFLAAVIAFVVMGIILMMPIYIKYAKDNPHHYWFKRKMFGWGWTPVTWQGWLVVVLYIGIVLALAASVDENSSSKEVAFMIILPVAILTALLIRIAFRKGESPRWEWGKNIGKYTK